MSSLATIQRSAPRGKAERADPGTVRRLGCLLETARIINSSLELNVVLHQILTQATGVLHAESGSIMLIEDGTHELRVLAAQGPRAQEIEGRTQRVGEGIAGWVALHGTPLLLRGAATDPRFQRICVRGDVREALCVPLRADGQTLGVMSLSNRSGGERFSEEDLELLIALASQAALAIRNARSFQEVKRQRQTVERLLSEINRAQEEERKRISFLLHDGPAQTLFAALRNLETASALAREDPQSLSRAIGEVEGALRLAIDETRAVMVDLRPLCLDEIGLLPALRQYGEQFERRTGVRTQVMQRGLARRLPPAVESCFYRIAQEALTNVWKHAGARSARVLVEVDDRSCWLEIGDDGQGLRPEALPVDEREHLGLCSIRDRTEMIGGTLVVTGTPGEGVTVRVTVPLADRSPGDR